MKNTVFCTSLNNEDLKLYEGLEAPIEVLNGLVSLYREEHQNFDALPSRESMKEMIFMHYTSKSAYNSYIELAEILKNAPRNEKGELLAPNGSLSNLSEIQYALVRTKKFKEQFGDWETTSSKTYKIVDENGEPTKEYIKEKENEGAFDPISFDLYEESPVKEYDNIDVALTASQNIADPRIELNTDYSIKAAIQLFNDYNKSKKNSELSKLAELVFKTATGLNLKYTFKDDIDIAARYKGNQIEINVQAISRENIHKLPYIILHETIHAVTTAQIDAYNKGKLRDNNIIEAVYTIKSIYEAIKDDESLQKEYGITNVKEMLAELSNPNFRSKLKVLNIWERIKNAIKSIFLSSAPMNTTAYTSLNKALEFLLNNYDNNIFANYVSNLTDSDNWDNLEEIPSAIQTKSFNSFQKDVRTLFVDLFSATPKKDGISNLLSFNLKNTNSENKKEKWADKDLEEFSKRFEENINTIKTYWKTGKYRRICIKSMDIFNKKGLNISEENTPKLHAKATKILNNLFEYVKNSSVRQYTNNVEDKDKSFILGEEGNSIGKLLNPKTAELGNNSVLFINNEKYVISKKDTIFNIYQDLVKNKYSYLSDKEKEIMYANLWEKWLSAETKIQLDGKEMSRKDLRTKLVESTMENTRFYSNDELNTAKAISLVINAYFNYKGMKLNKDQSIKNTLEYTPPKQEFNVEIRIRNFSQEEWEKYKDDYPNAYIVTENDKQVINSFLQKATDINDIYSNDILISYFKELAKNNPNISNVIYISEKTKEQEEQNEWVDENACQVFQRAYLYATNNLPEYFLRTAVLPELDVALESIKNTVSQTINAVPESGSSKLHKYPRAIRNLCTNLIGSIFKDQIDIVLEERIQNIKNIIESSKSNLDVDKKLKMVRVLSKLQSSDTTEVMTTFLEENNSNLNNVIEKVKNGIQDIITEYNEVFRDMEDATESESGSIDFLAALLEDSDKNNPNSMFYAYLDYCSGAIQDHTGGLRIKFQSDKTMETTETENSDYEEGNVEEIENDNVDIELSPANAGWGYKAKFIDSYTALSKNIRRILSQIPVDKQDFFMIQTYLPISHTYNTLLSLFAENVFSVEDFVVFKDGKYSFPLFDKYKGVYGWLTNIKNTINNNPELIAGFYRNFNLTFHTYLSVDEQFDELGETYLASHILNNPSLQDNVVKPALNLMESGVEIESGGLHYNLDEVTFNSRKKALQKDIESLNYSNPNETFFKQMTSILRRLCIPISEQEVENLLQEDKVRQSLLSDLNSLLKSYSWDSKEKKPSIASGYHKMLTLARTLNYLPIVGHTLTFTYGEVRRPSYSAPSFFDNIFRSIKYMNKKGLEKIIDSVSSDPFYYNTEKDGTKVFINPLLQRINSQLKNIKNLVPNTSVFTDFTTGDLIYIKGKEFGEWTVTDIEDAFLKLYYGQNKGVESQAYTKSVWYNMPITANSPSTQMVRLTSYLNNELYSVDKYYENLKEKTSEDFTKSILNIFISNMSNTGINISSENDIRIAGLMPLYVDIVKQEIQRIRRVVERSKDKSVRKISGLDDAGLHFCTIPELNNFTLEGKTLLDVIEEDPGNIEQYIHLYTASVITKKASDYVKAYIERHPIKEDGTGRPYSNIEVYEYFLDSFITSTHLSQLVYGDPAYHTNEITQAKRAKESGAAGPRPCTTIEEGKTHSNTLVVKDKEGPTRAFPLLRKVIENKPISADKKRALLKGLLNINHTDGQSYRIVESARILYKMMNLWDESKESTYTNLIKGKLSINDIYDNFQPIKSFVYTILNIPEKGGITCRTPIQLKHCETILTEAYDSIGGTSQKSAKLSMLHKVLRDNNIDVLEMASNNKVGMVGVLDINYNPVNLNPVLDVLIENYPLLEKDRKNLIKSNYSEIKDYLDDLLLDNIITWEHYQEALNGLEYSNDQLDSLKTYIEANIYSDKQSRTFNPAIVKAIPYEDFVEAQPTPEHLFDTTHLIGGQFKHIIKSNLPRNATFKVGDYEMSSYTIKNIINDILSINTLEGCNNAMKHLQYLDDIQNVIINQIKSNSKLGQHLIDFFAIEEQEEGYSDFAIPINYPGNFKTLQQSFYSIMRKNISKIHTKGGAATAIASYGYDLSMILTETPNGIVPVGVECMLPFQYRNMYAEFIDDRGYIDIDKVPEELRRIIGYRIPTEDKYSLIPLYVKGFLPSYMGSTIMVAPEAMVWLTGGDHDGDHVHMMFPNFEVSKGKVTKVEYTIDNVFALSRVQRDNLLFDTVWAVLTSPYIIDQMVSPGHFDDMKWGRIFHNIIINKDSMTRTALAMRYSLNENSGRDVFRELAIQLLNTDLNSIKKLSDSSITNSPFTIDSYLRMHSSIAVGDKLIGQSALNTIGAIKIQNDNEASPIVLKDDYKLTLKGFDSSDRDREFQTITINPVNSYDNTLVSSNCAQTSAAFVDHGKDPTAESANLNTKTFDMLGALIRIGIPLKHAIVIMNMPYIYESVNNFGTVSFPKISKNKDNHDKDLNIVECLTDTLQYFYKKGLVQELQFQNTEGNQDAIKSLIQDMQILMEKHYLNISKIKHISKVVQIYTNLLKIDSVNGSIKNNIGSVFAQLGKYVSDINNLEKYLKEGFTSFALDLGNEYVGETLKYKSLAQDIKKVSTIPDVQSALTATEIAQNSVLEIFGLNHPTFLAYINTLLANAKYDTFHTEKFITAFCEEFSSYVASGTELLGDTKDSTYDIKYDYAVNKFPINFILLRNTELWKNSALSKLSVFNYLLSTKNRLGQIVITLRRFGGITEDQRDIFRKDLDTLWSIAYTDSNEKVREAALEVATYLFLHAYYRNGFITRSDSYVELFTRDYLNHFPEYLNSLRSIPTGEVFTDDNMFRYLDQFYYNHANDLGANYLLQTCTPISINEEEAVCEISASTFYKNKTAINSNIIPTHIFIQVPNTYQRFLCVIADRDDLVFNSDIQEGDTIKYKVMGINIFGGLKYNINSNNIAKVNIKPETITFTDTEVEETEDLDSNTKTSSYLEDGEVQDMNDNKPPMC